MGLSNLQTEVLRAIAIITENNEQANPASVQGLIGETVITKQNIYGIVSVLKKGGYIETHPTQAGGGLGLKTYYTVTTEGFKAVGMTPKAAEHPDSIGGFIDETLEDHYATAAPGTIKTNRQRLLKVSDILPMSIAEITPKDVDALAYSLACLFQSHQTMADCVRLALRVCDTAAKNEVIASKTTIKALRRLHGTLRKKVKEVRDSKPSPKDSFPAVPPRPSLFRRVAAFLSAMFCFKGGAA